MEVGFWGAGLDYSDVRPLHLLFFALCLRMNASSRKRGAEAKASGSNRGAAAEADAIKELSGLAMQLNSACKIRSEMLLHKAAGVSKYVGGYAGPTQM